jgi:hypothetical protein
MQRTYFVLLFAMASYCVGAPANALAANAKCTSIQAQCAVEMGGTCDPVTGRWCYGNFMSRRCGGSNIAGAFDLCVSRKLRERK